MSILDRFRKRIKLIDNGCWEWQGFRYPSGYGQFWMLGKDHRAHRASYILFIGEIPKYYMVCHTCDNPACVNPKHLFLGTHQDNMVDRNKKDRQAKGIRHGLRKLSDEERLIIYNSTDPQRQIAKQFGISQSSVWRIKMGFKKVDYE